MSAFYSPYSSFRGSRKRSKVGALLVRRIRSLSGKRAQRRANSAIRPSVVYCACPSPTNGLEGASVRVLELLDAPPVQRLLHRISWVTRSPSDPFTIMPLVELWKKTPEQFHGKTIQQVLGFAGDGRLKDGNSTSVEFREFLAHLPSSELSLFANQCLETAFPDSGFALQDIANQVGNRLGFRVENGRYRGNPNALGFDGLWHTADGETILVEVKTTDAYRLSLDTAAEYRRKLIQEKKLSEDKSSILYIVGRSDTGDLEAQVRGSRYAWDIRLISVEALLRLLGIKERPLIASRIS